MREYQICSRCVMDTTDSKIIFDENGVWWITAPGILIIMLSPIGIPMSVAG